MTARLDIAAALAAGSLHELRNLMAVVESSVVLAQGAQGEGQAKLLAKAARSARTAQDLLGRMLDVARGALLVKETVATERVIDDALAAVVLGPNVRLTVEVRDGAGQTLCEPLLLARAIANLVANAAEAVEAGGSVCVAAERAAGGGVRIEVWDDGPGLDEAELWTGRTTKPHGTGMGLLVARAVVEAHGGRVGYERRAPGSAFLIDLPGARLTP